MEGVYKYVTQLANAQRRLIDRLARDRAYSGAQGKVIHYLFENKDRTVYQKDIERDFGVRPATATELIKTLEKMEMINQVLLIILFLLMFLKKIFLITLNNLSI